MIKLVRKELELETQYAYDTMQKILGINASLYEEFIKFIANRRLTQVGLPEQYPGATNPFEWMSEIMDLKRKRISSRHVTEYKTGSQLKFD